MEIDATKLKKMIQQFVHETQGMCYETSAVIGMIDGKKILITVTQDDEDERAELVDKWRCIQ